LRKEAARAGHQVAALSSGEVLFPALLSQLESGRTVLAGMRLAEIDVLSPGALDLDRGVEPLLAASALGSPRLVSACLTERGEGELLLEPFHVLELGPLRIAVIGVARRDLIQVTSPRAAQAVDLRPAPDAVAETVLAIREGNLADAIVCLGDVDDREAVDILNREPGVLGVLARAAGRDGASSYRAWGFGQDGHLGTRPTGLVVAPPPRGRGVGRLDLTFVPRPNGGYVATQALFTLERPREGDSEDQAVRRLVELAAQRFESASDPVLTPLAPTIEGGLDRDRMATLLASLLRRRTGAEIGIVSRRLVNGPVLTDVNARGELREIDLQNLIEPSDVALVTVEGRWLQNLLERAGGDHPLSFVGLSRGPRGTITVNGRPLVQNERYTVATTAFLASGRAGYKQLAALPAEKTFDREPNGDLDADEDGSPMPLPRLFGRLVEAEQGSREARTHDSLDVDEPGPIHLTYEAAFIRPPLWRLAFESVRATFSTIRAKQDDAFDPVRDKRANANNQEVIEGAGRIALTRWSESTRLDWSTSFRFTRVDVDGEEAQTAQDDLRFRFQATPVFLSFPTMLPDVELAPFGSLELDTEFERPEGSGAHRQKELFLSTGLVNPYPSDLFRTLRLGVFASYNITDPDDRVWTGGLELQLRHEQNLFDRVQLNAGLRGRLFVLESEPEDGDLVWFLEPSLLVSLPFFFNLQLVFDANAFLFKQPGVEPIGYHYRFAVGISYSHAFKL
jgi:2',3'-cyclic-nucleotide 2'-phosphodiesterase (5'-nucleotidase family)